MRKDKFVVGYRHVREDQGAVFRLRVYHYLSCKYPKKTLRETVEVNWVFLSEEYHTNELYDDFEMKGSI